VSRTVVKGFGALVFGAAVSISVAWVVSLRVDRGKQEQLMLMRGEKRLAQPPWPFAVPADWGEPVYGYMKTSPAVRCDVISGDSHHGLIREAEVWSFGWPLTAISYERRCWGDNPGISSFQIQYHGAWTLPIWLDERLPGPLEPLPGLLGRAVPLLPRWLGLAADSVLYGGGMWATVGAAAEVRRYSRRRRGLCPSCAYAVGVSERCTECGEMVRARPGAGT
jgi:hypothetical protein